MTLAKSRSAAALVAVSLAALVAAGTEAVAAPATPASRSTATLAPDQVGKSVQVGARVGHWTVTSLGHHRYQLTWTSPTPLQLTDARAQVVSKQGLPVGTTAFTRNRHAVSVTLRSPAPPSVKDFHVAMGGKLLDTGATVGAGSNRPLTPPAHVATLGDDPGIPGNHAITTSDYTVDPVALPGLKLRSEMVGHVVAPVDATNSSPLVLFLHGRHEACFRLAAGQDNPMPTVHRSGRNWGCRGASQAPVPSYLGYDYAQRLLATQGYVTVSISADAINDQDWQVADGGAEDRSVLIQRHLDAWADFVTAGTYHADLSDVVLVGHSRGGEGVDRASLDIPSSAPYAVTGQVLIGPTDFGYQTAPFTPTVTLLPYCDGDVSDLQGQNFTDLSRDITNQPIAFHSSVLVMGADHNFFNSEWTPGISAAPSFDDWYGNPAKTCGVDNPSRLSPLGQRKVGKTYIAGAVHLFASGDTDMLPLFDGSAVAVASADSADVRSHSIGGDAVTVRPGLDASLSTPLGATTRLCQGRAAFRPSANVCDPGIDAVKTPHWPANYGLQAPTRPAFEMTWSAADQEGGLSLDSPWDLSGDATLDLRTIVDPTMGKVRLLVRLEDASGSTVVKPLNRGTLPALPSGGYSLGKRWAQTLRVPLDGVTGVDLSAITGVDLVGKSADGQVWVLDASATPAVASPPPPVRYFPTISLSDVSQVEGDGPGPAILAVPYTINGTLTANATIKVATQDPFSSTPTPPQTVVIPSGTSSGTIDISYQPNTIDDRKRAISVAAVALHGIETSRYLAIATITDDDPAPTIDTSVEKSPITEGQPAQWNITLSAPVGYGLGIVGKPVAPASGKELTVGDLKPKFRTRWFGRVPPLNRPLSKTRLQLYAFIEPGETTGTISLPTVADHKTEGRRVVALKLRARGFTIPTDVRSVVVTD